MNFIPDISTTYSLLTRISEDDLSRLKEVFDDVDTRRFLPELYELLDAPDGLQRLTSTFDLYAQNGEGYLWGIKHNNELAGFVAVMDISYEPAVFYAMHPDSRSHGYMKESISAVIDYLQKYGLCHYISTDVYKENLISIHILEQLGFNIYTEDEEKVYLSRALA